MSPFTALVPGASKNRNNVVYTKFLDPASTSDVMVESGNWDLGEFFK